MTEEFRKLLLLPEDLGLVPRAHERGSQPSATPAPGTQCLLLVSRGTSTDMTHLCTHMKKENFKK